VRGVTQEGKPNGAGKSFIGLSITCDGRFWAPMVVVVRSRGHEGRTYDQPVDGFVMRRGLLYALVHRDVSGISPRARTRGRLEWHELRRDFVERMTRAAHASLPGCSTSASLSAPTEAAASGMGMAQPSVALMPVDEHAAVISTADASVMPAGDGDGAAAAIDEFARAMTRDIATVEAPNTTFSTTNIGWVYDRRLTFGGGASCAIVGSGATLLGRGLGKTIDAHDFVIRVNRLPTAREHTRDVGARTSVWFGKMCRFKPCACCKIGRIASVESHAPSSRFFSPFSPSFQISPLISPAVHILAHLLMKVHPLP
jgi:hypothetical protein